MGAPTACAALAGGALYRSSYGLPFIVVAGLGGAMVLVLLLAGHGGRARAATGLPSPTSATLGPTKETT
jgi:hypothetical protein